MVFIIHKLTMALQIVTNIVRCFNKFHVKATQELGAMLLLS
jgi:hypothetical protein